VEDSELEEDSVVVLGVASGGDSGLNIIPFVPAP